MKFGKTFANHKLPEWSSYYLDYKNLKKIIKEINKVQDKLYKNERGGVQLHGAPPTKIRDSSKEENNYLEDEQVQNLLGSFFFALDKDIEKIDDFYNKQYHELHKKLQRIVTSNQYNDINAVVVKRVKTPDGRLPYAKPLIKHVSTNELHSQHIDFSNVGENVISVSGISPSANSILSSEKESPSLPLQPTPHHLDDISEVSAIVSELKGQFKNLLWYSELNKRAIYKILKKLDKKVGTKEQESMITKRLVNLPFISEKKIGKDLNILNEMISKINAEYRVPRGESGDNAQKIANLTGVQYNLPGDEAMNHEFSMIAMLPIIHKDDPENMVAEIEKMYGTTENVPSRIIINLLNKAALANSMKCVDRILELNPPFNDPLNINKRNFFHHHIMALGQLYAVPKHSGSIKKKHGNFNLDDCGSTESLMDLQDIRERYYAKYNRTAAKQKEELLTEHNTVPTSEPLLHILRKLPIHSRSCLLMADNYKRTPLHYAAKYGLVDFVEIIIKTLKSWGVWKSERAIDNVAEWGDSDMLTPLHHAVLGLHVDTIKMLLSSMKDGVMLKSPQLLHVAAKFNSYVTLDTLLSSKRILVDHLDDDSDETALYQSCRANAFESVACLLYHQANTEIKEKLFGWTPIFVAAAEGLEEIVQLLIDSGADFNVFDESGWTPMEHAVLRGHLKIADMIQFENNDEVLHPVAAKLRTASDDEKIEKQGFDREISSLEKKGDNADSLETTKAVGNNHLDSNENMILITIGSNDVRNNQKSINLIESISPVNPFSELDSALSLVISCEQDPKKNSITMDLPLDDAVETIKFKVPITENSEYTLRFDIVRTYDENVSQLDKKFENIQNNSDDIESNNQSIVGRGVAIVAKSYASVGINKRLLDDRVKIPIMCQQTLQILGELRFEYMIVTPFYHPTMKNGLEETYWKKLVSTRVIGHRGLGKNFHSSKSLQLGENTVESFIAAASLGASYVEFDVQLTKDYIPVVYHDFLVAETGVDIPMHELTLEQFFELNKHIRNNISSGMGYMLPSKKSTNVEEIVNKSTKTNDSNGLKDEVKSENKQSNRKVPFYSADDSALKESSDKMSDLALNQDFDFNHSRAQRREYRDIDEIKRSTTATNSRKWNFNEVLNRVMQDRMRLTKAFKKNNFKGNTRGHSIASSFVTMRELFDKIPRDVGFNIECKYPMLDEAQEDDFLQVVIEMNHWLDTVLQVVYDHSNGRNIIFSSFHPDICIMLSLKQPNFPILFLTEAGSTPMADIRAISLQNAVRFARSWNLMGIVSAALPIVKAPRLVQVVKSNGLVCVTYGVENNDPSNSSIEIEAGVDAVIVDSVLAVRKGLTEL